MPTIRIERDALFKRIGQTFTEKEFDELCFEFGIELDDVVEENKILYYKIEIPANRYDILCIEGLSLALRVFLRNEETPNFRLSGEPKIELRVKPETAAIRPFVVAAVLRNVAIDQAAYESFIDFQDKLHQNICRKRTLVAIGTHDLDTMDVSGPVTYEARVPSDIQFKPLNLGSVMDGNAIIEHYSKDVHMRPYAAIIKDAPRFPLISDCKKTVLSLPPLINGDHSKLTTNTRNVFIECTATDLTKASVVLNNLVCAFSTYCENRFTVEPVRVVYEADGRTEQWPQLTVPVFECNPTKMCANIGAQIATEKVCELLSRMMLMPESGASATSVKVHVPPSRADILHECDIAEDLAIAYGFNHIEHRMPESSTVGRQLPLNKLTDQVRLELAMCGYTEVLTLALCSRDENFVDSDRAVKIANPKTFEFQVGRTSLLSGLLKTLGSNKSHPLPIKLFEVSDVLLKSDTTDTGACNERRAAALYSSTASGFEIIHGLVDRMLQQMAVPAQSITVKEATATDVPYLFPGRAAEVLVNGKRVGVFGVVHPEILAKFELPYPCSVCELNLEPFL
jgi:phenylalanyl-tRNA synthetase beta chain